MLKGIWDMYAVRMDGQEETPARMGLAMSIALAGRAGRFCSMADGKMNELMTRVVCREAPGGTEVILYALTVDGTEVEISRAVVDAQGLMTIDTMRGAYILLRPREGWQRLMTDEQ
jgi:hypothetical protein